jgi:hypothetical protein
MGKFSCRIQYFYGLAITPSLKLLKYPAPNIGNDRLSLWGVLFGRTL